MATISLCMIVKNEEEVLARCLDSIKAAVDEIIIVDTGSTDRTRDIALGYTTKVYDFKWIDDFSAARNFAFSKASCDYQMWLDADDVFPQQSCTQLIELKNTLVADIVTMGYITSFDKNGMPLSSCTRERLLKRSNNYKWQDPVHECIPLAGDVLYSKMVVHHKKPPVAQRSSRNINIYNNMEKRQQEFTPRQLYYYARELKDHSHWAKSAHYFEKFLNHSRGWTEDKIGACYNLAICYKKLGERGKILPSLAKSFEYASPRAEVCCEIGYFYKDEKNYPLAYKWFELATKLGKANNIGFVIEDCWGYIPNIECCYCLCQLKFYKLANKFNETAASYKPDARAVAINRAFIKSQ